MTAVVETIDADADIVRPRSTLFTVDRRRLPVVRRGQVGRADQSARSILRAVKAYNEHGAPR